MPTVSIDVAHSQELVEFWSTKYKAAKDELDALKVELRTTGCSNEKLLLNEVLSTLKIDAQCRKTSDAKILDAITTSTESLRELRTHLSESEKENLELTKRVGSLEAERVTLSVQIQQFCLQSRMLAHEAEEHRTRTLASLFPATDFITVSSPVKLAQPYLIRNSLPPEFNGLHLYLVPRPPSYLPVRVPAPGKHGYWFYPPWVLPLDLEFELIVEVRETEWLYLGRYTSTMFEGGEMKLSEWLNLDEQTKSKHCMRVASQTAPPGSVPSLAAQAEVKRKYEVGEWSVPCYSLRCVGYNVTLFHALHAASVIQSNVKRRLDVLAESCRNDAAAQVVRESTCKEVIRESGSNKENVASRPKKKVKTERYTKSP
ncbi:hypothetical protein NEOLEDRAFT_1170342 [Neolentinus lepideus HHB14362 ss-1]|uniref:DUF6697 domain-containing protein n=1 Tax=Neolentinus lepideus HHB14362 ss-1 TaxID=1314782 RepID=A0A165RMV8_9AGAM|nr:hypothetical protein NEOLEDRAFT_1170342 [Neolentinus lepideus HHB14362 ss-1]